MNKESPMELEHNLYPNLLNLYGITVLQWHHYDLNQYILIITKRWKLFCASERSTGKNTGRVSLSILHNKSHSPEREGNDVKPLLFIALAYSLSRSYIDSKYQGPCCSQTIDEDKGKTKMDLKHQKFALRQNKPVMS